MSKIISVILTVVIAFLSFVIYMQNEEIAGLKQRLNDNLIEISHKSDEIIELNKSAANPALKTSPTTKPTSAPNPTPTPQKQSRTVYIGKTGTKYHKQSCPTLKGKGTAVSYDYAISQGREACKVCYK